MRVRQHSTYNLTAEQACHRRAERVPERNALVECERCCAVASVGLHAWRLVITYRSKDSADGPRHADCGGLWKPYDIASFPYHAGDTVIVKTPHAQGGQWVNKNRAAILVANDPSEGCLRAVTLTTQPISGRNKRRPALDHASESGINEGAFVWTERGLPLAPVYMGGIHHRLGHAHQETVLQLWRLGLISAEQGKSMVFAAPLKRPER